MLTSLHVNSTFESITLRYLKKKVSKAQIDRFSIRFSLGILPSYPYHPLYVYFCKRRPFNNTGNEAWANVLTLLETKKNTSTCILLFLLS